MEVAEVMEVMEVVRCVVEVVEVIKFTESIKLQKNYAIYNEKEIVKKIINIESKKYENS